MAIFSDKRLFWTSLLIFFQVGVLVATAGYVNSGLLSTYSTNVLPYYYLVSAVLSVGMVLLSQKAIQKHPQEYIYWFYWISFFVTIIFFFLSSSNVPGAIFAICSILGVIASVILVVNSNSIFLAFDIRELRQVSSRIIIISCVAGILFALICPALIKIFGSNVLITINSVLYLGGLVSNSRLKPLKESTSSIDQENMQPLSIPIFRLIVMCSVLFFACNILLDYSFKLSLKQNFDQNMIAMVTTLFVGMISFLLILSQVIGRRSLVQKYGVVNTLLFLPVILIVFGILVLIFPTIISIMLLCGVLYIYSNGPSFNAIQTLYNVIPRKGQFLAKAQSFIIVTLVGNAVIPTTLLLLLGEKYATIRVVVFIAIVLLFLSIIVLWRIKVSYCEHLKMLVEQPRFLQLENVTFSEDIDTKEIVEVIPQIGHLYSIYDALLYFKNREINPISYLMSGLNTTKDFLNFEARVKMIGKIPSKEVEGCFVELMNCKLAVLPNAIPLTIAIRSLVGLSEPFRKVILKKLNSESQTILSLKQLIQKSCPEHFLLEVKARLELATHRFFYYFASLHHTREVLNVLPNILDQIFVKSEQVKRANAIEYLDTITEDLDLKELLQKTMDQQFHPIIKEEFYELMSHDPWLSRIKLIKNFNPGAHMNTTEKALFLRHVKLFESLPSEILELIAEPLLEETIKAKRIIFSKGEEALKVYMVVSGTVSIEGKNHVLNLIPQYGLFGELGILGNIPRVATAIAKTDVILLSIHKQEFLQLLEDIPEISKAIIHQLVGYLKEKDEEI